MGVSFCAFDSITYTEWGTRLCRIVGRSRNDLELQVARPTDGPATLGPGGVLMLVRSISFFYMHASWYASLFDAATVSAIKSISALDNMRSDYI